MCSTYIGRVKRNLSLPAYGGVKGELKGGRRWYARMLLDRDGPGDRVKARALLTEAIAMYRRIGMPKHVEMAEALLREVEGSR